MLGVSLTPKRETSMMSDEEQIRSELGAREQLLWYGRRRPYPRAERLADGVAALILGGIAAGLAWLAVAFYSIHGVGYLMIVTLCMVAFLVFLLVDFTIL